MNKKFIIVTKNAWLEIHWKLHNLHHRQLHFIWLRPCEVGIASYDHIST